MNIKSLSSTDSFKASKPIKSNAKPSFSGCILTQDSTGTDIYKFMVPNAAPGTKVEVVVMDKDKNNDYKVHEKSKFYDIPTGFNPLILTEDDITVSKNSVLGYKFTVPNKSDYKESCVTGDQGFHIATSPLNANISMPKVIEHIFIDAFNVKDPEALKTTRNHVNIMGGNINSVREKVPELANAGFTDVLGNPLIGQDNKSSQGYWTTNPYQITKNLGTITDFRNLMIDLYKNQMKWIADGAFVNEGMEGVHVTDILTNGSKSPFLYYVETKDLNNLTAKLGVFSKNKEANKHLHIQLMNAPYKIKFVKEGDKYVEKEVKSTSYDATKATYIQIFDDRLASEEQMNGSEIFDVYAKRTTGDKNDITNYMSSAQAYHMKVRPQEVEANYGKYKEAKHYDKNIEFKNSLTRWTNFEIVESNADGGIALWVGNSDIAKKRFIAPEQSIIDQMENPESKQLVQAAPFQVQDDTIQVGKFWTNEVARTITEETARELAKEVKNGKTYEEAVIKLADENKIPKYAKIITEKSDGETDSPLENILTEDPVEETERLYKLKPFKTPVSLTDGMMSYPFDAIEFAPDLVSVFAYPYIKNLAVTEETVGKSRYEMYQMGDAYYDMMPKEYRKLYKEMDSVIASDMKNQAKSIMGQVGRKLNIKMFDEKENLTQEGKEIFALVAPDIAKFLIVSALAPKIMPKENDKMLEYDINELGTISLNSLNLQYENSPEETAARLIHKIQKGVDGIDENKKAVIVEHLLKRLNNINSDAINVARLIVEKTESGLNWRIDAAKDVGMPELTADKKYSDDKNKDEIKKFWNKFNTFGVTAYNPKAYKIGELTNWEANTYAEFKSKSGFTTISDYEFFYSVLPALFGRNDEGKSRTNIATVGNQEGVIQDRLFTPPGEMKNIRLFDSGIEESINYAHRFVGNHDKPRILHLFALDTEKFVGDDNIPGAKASAMADALVRGFHRSAKYHELQDNFKSDIYEVIMNVLQNGKYLKNGIEKEFDPENFGVRPFDVNIDDVIEQVSERNKEFKNYVHNNPKKIEELKADVLQKILAPALEKYRALWFAMNAIPGAPTNYAGDEFGMTGWETKCKNEKQQNRNPIRWDRLNDPNYAFIADYKRKIDDITRIRKKEAASALSNGSTIKLEDQNTSGERKAVVLYRYNDKTDAICLIHNNGFNGNIDDAGKDVHLDSIILKGLPNGLQSGTIYRDALNPSSRYKVVNSVEIKKIDDSGHEQNDINLGNAGLILLRDTDFKGKALSFKGRMENANVKLANTKYNFSAPVYSKI